MKLDSSFGNRTLPIWFPSMSRSKKVIVPPGSASLCSHRTIKIKKKISGRA